MIEIVAAALIPFAAGLRADPVITGGLGVIVVVLESMQGLFQFQQNWTNYRSTAEGLKHEKFLWQARAGPYKDLEDPDALFAERVEALISTEHAKWATYQEQAGKGKEQKNRVTQHGRGSGMRFFLDEEFQNAPIADNTTNQQP